MTLNNISKNKSWLYATALAGAMLPAPAAFAETISFVAEDGTAVVSGDFVSYEDGIYTVQTELGELRISGFGLTCEGPDCLQSADVEVNMRVAGSDTIGLGVMPLLMEAYGTNQRAATTITETDVERQYLVEYIGDNGFGELIDTYLVTSTSSSDAFTTLLDGSAEIGMASRRITREEARALRDTGAGSMVNPRQEHVLAVDSIVVITHPDNPVDTLTVDQLAEIYTGESRNWSNFGGPDLPIVVVHFEAGSATGAVFNERILGAADTPISKAAVRMSDQVSVAAIVNAEPSVIGFVGFAFQRGAQPVTLISDCNIVMEPNAFSARTEEYLLQRRLYLYNRADTLTDEASAFLDFVQSPEVDGVILKSGFVDLGVARQTMPMDGSRAMTLMNRDTDAYEEGVIRSLLDEMAGFERLSTTFRFAAASSTLDERGRIDLERLAAYLEFQPEGTEIRFVGFTDDEGQFDGNLGLSVNRATQVMNEFQSYAGDRVVGITMGSSGYGELSPAGCNTSADGRRTNRRVEVWISN